MYCKDKSFIVRSSASAIPNNLCCNWSETRNELRFAVIHKNTVNVLNVDIHGEQSYHVCTRDSDNLILQVKLCNVQNTLLLVLASQEGVQIYDIEGSLIHWHSFSNQEDTLAVDSFARGICMVNDYLCVGTYDGVILAFRAKTIYTLSQVQPNVLKFHTSPITHLCSTSNTLISADDTGLICIWKKEDSGIRKSHNFDSYGFPCLSIAVWLDMIVAGFSSGHLRVFSITSRALCSEVVAHARSITSVDVAVSTGLTLSASEDSFIRIWQLINDGIQKSIEFRCTILVPDYQLCGACFYSNDGTKIAVTAYDSEEIFCYKLTQ